MDRDKLIIRKAGEPDIGIMCAMLAGLFAVETDFRIDEHKQKNALNLIIKDDNKSAFVAMRDDSVTGMITGQMVVSTAVGGYSVLLEDLFVLPRYRGRGIAGRLIIELELWGRTKGAIRIQLVADKRNRAALELYKKAGFMQSAMTGLYKEIS